MNAVIVLRGDTFRGTIGNQIKAYKSIIDHVIKPLNIPDKNVYIYIVTYAHPYNYIPYEIFRNYNVKKTVHAKTTQPANFITSINMVDDGVIDICDFIIIMRNDLYFLKDLDYTRLSPDKFLFQWNLFHQRSTGEYADQILCVGKTLIKKFRDKINQERIDVNWPGTLHNLYNFCSTHFGEENISYLNYIENPNPDDDICKIRGNPSAQLGNNLYNYTRFM